MTYYDTQQQNPAHNSPFNPQQWAAFSSQAAQPYGAWPSAPSMQAIGGYGLGQAPYGQQYGQYGGQPSTGAFGYNAAWGAQPQGWGQQQQPQWGGQQQRQLSQQDVSEVVRQLVPALPQILAQAQQPHAAIGYAAYGQAPLRPGAAPAEPAGGERSGEADRWNAAEPAAATICGHARRPRLRSARLRSARLGSIWPGSIRAGQSSAEPRRAIWRAAIPVGVRRSSRLGTTAATNPTGCRGYYAPAYRGDPPGDREPPGFQPAAHDLIATDGASIRVATGDCRLPKAAVAASPL